MSFDFKVNIGQKERGKEAGDIEALFSDSTPKKKKNPHYNLKFSYFFLISNLMKMETVLLLNGA